MATFKPLKKWLIPIVAACIGFSVGFLLLPSKQDHVFQQWLTILDSLAEQQYDIDTTYQRDGQRVAGSEGIWSTERSTYQITTPVSDGSEFSFSVYFEGSRFFIYSGEEWWQGESPHRFVQELSPLDHPFQWSKKLLQEADQLQINKQGNRVTYMAHFVVFNDIDFRGILLKDQLETTLTMVMENDQLRSIIFQAQPIKPENIGIFTSYPENITYDMQFSLFEGE
jgi:hypothetical protein